VNYLPAKVNGNSDAAMRRAVRTEVVPTVAEARVAAARVGVTRVADVRVVVNRAAVRRAAAVTTETITAADNQGLPATIHMVAGAAAGNKSETI
jgi:uncharacterized lipoprotein NlpE involved in copper resistance